MLLGAALVFERGTGRVPVTPALTTTAVAAAAVLGLQAAAGTRYARLVASAGEDPGRLSGHE